MSKPILHHFVIETSEGLCFTWIGGRLIPDGKDHVWLTTPGGRKVFRALRKEVSPSSPEDFIKRVKNDQLMNRAPNN